MIVTSDTLETEVLGCSPNTESAPVDALTSPT